METEYEQLKLDNLSLTEQVENLQAQLGGNAGGDNNAAEPSDTNSNSGSNAQITPANTNSGSKHIQYRPETHSGELRLRCTETALTMTEFLLQTDLLKMIKSERV